MSPVPAHQSTRMGTGRAAPSGLLKHIAAGRLCCHNLRHGNDFRSMGDCGPTPSSRSATGRRADLPADSCRRAESCRRLAPVGGNQRADRQSPGCCRVHPPRPDGETRLGQGALQPGQCLEGAREAGRSGRLLPAGPGIDAGPGQGAQQPGHCLERPGQAGRSGRFLPPGAEAEAGLCRGTLQPGRRLGGDRRSSQRRRLLSRGVAAQFPLRLRALRTGETPGRQASAEGPGCAAPLAGGKGVDGRPAIVLALRPGPRPGRTGRVC